MRIHQMDDTWQLQYLRWLQKMLRHYDQDETQLMVRDIGTVLLNAFAQEGTRFP